jgi:hypothetical protein
LYEKLKWNYLWSPQKLKCFFLDWKKALTQPTQQIEIMPSANFKTTICRHYEMGCCFKTKEQCQFAHGLTDLRKHCHFGFTCQRGLACQFPHHPQEIEYFTLKAQAKPKIMKNMATQTDFQALPLATPQDFMTPIDDLPLPPPPPEFTDDESDEEMTPHEKLKLSKRKSTAKWNIKHGIKKLEDYDQITWRTIKKAEKQLNEAQRRALYTRKCQAQKHIREGTKTREDYDENYYQVKRKTYNLVILD